MKFFDHSSFEEVSSVEVVVVQLVRREYEDIRIELWRFLTKGPMSLCSDVSFFWDKCILYTLNL